MDRGDRFTFGTVTGVVVGVAVVVLHLCFARNWMEQSILSVFFFILDGMGLGIVAGIAGGLIGLVLAWTYVQWHGPVLGTIAGAALGIAWNWIAIKGEWHYGPFLNEAAAVRTLLFAFGGTVLGSVVGGQWSSGQKAG